MERHVLGTIVGYKPEIGVSLYDDLIDIRVRGIPERIARLPRDTTEAIVTAEGLLFYSRANGSIHMIAPDQQERIVQIVKEHDQRKKLPVAHIEVKDEMLIAMLHSYESLIDTLKRQLFSVLTEYGAIKDELTSIQAELASLKAKATQQPPHDATGAIMAWSEPCSLRDGLTAVPDNPFTRRRP